MRPSSLTLCESYERMSLADKTYATVAGFVQFDPRERDVNNQTVTDIVVKAIGSQKLVRITVWPEFEVGEISKGDFVAADGVFTTSVGQTDDGSTREYLNLSASVLSVLPSVPKKERSVVSKGSSSKKAEGDLPF